MSRTFSILLTILLICTFSACSGSDKKLTLGESSQPRTNIEELRREADFDKNEFYTSDEHSSKPHVIRADIPATNSSLKRGTNPDIVWDETELLGSADYTLPDAVMLPNGNTGVLYIPKMDLKANIYETDSAIEDMKIGVAHMKETSCWDGNVGLAAHNRGASTYFGRLHWLAKGDEVTLTTALGTRTYVVTKIATIDEMDWSMFCRSDKNMITMLTCIDNQPTKRLCVQAEEVVSTP